MKIGQVIAYFRFSKWRPSAILDFHIFAIFVKNSNLCLFVRRHAKFGEDRTIRGRVLAYYRFSKWRPSAILDFIFSKYLSKIQICAYLSIGIQNLVKIGRSVAELLRIFGFQNGGRPLSWIWYNVIADHPRLVFDGPNIVLNLHVDRDFHIRPVWLEISYSRPCLGSFGGYYPQMNSNIVTTPKGPSLGENTLYEP